MPGWDRSISMKKSSSPFDKDKAIFEVPARFSLAETVDIAGTSNQRLNAARFWLPDTVNIAGSASRQLNAAHFSLSDTIDIAGTVNQNLNAAGF